LGVDQAGIEALELSFRLALDLLSRAFSAPMPQIEGGDPVSNRGASEGRIRVQTFLPRTFSNAERRAPSYAAGTDR
jgi:hypothetical protein